MQISYLRVFRPAGSTEVYYVESGVDDNMSVTTMESTHAGRGLITLVMKLDEC